MGDYTKHSKDGGNTNGRGPDERKRRKPTPKEMRNLIAMQKLMDKAKQSTGQKRAQNEAEKSTKALNESLGGRGDSRRLSDEIKGFLVKCLAEVVMFMVYLFSPIIVAVLIALFMEPLMELETWITAFIDRGSISFADKIVQIEHYQHRTEAFSSNLKDGIIGGSVLFIMFFFRRLIKGCWIHQER